MAVWIKFGSEKWSKLLVTPILKPCYTHLFSDRGDNSSTSATRSYRQQDLRKRMSKLISDKGVFRAAPATPGLLKIRGTPLILC